MQVDFDLSDFQTDSPTALAADLQCQVHRRQIRSKDSVALADQVYAPVVVVLAEVVLGELAVPAEVHFLVGPKAVRSKNSAVAGREAVYELAARFAAVADSITWHVPVALVAIHSVGQGSEL